LQKLIQMKPLAPFARSTQMDKVVWNLPTFLPSREIEEDNLGVHDFELHAALAREQWIICRKALAIPGHSNAFFAQRWSTTCSEVLADLLRDPLTRLYTRDGFLTLGGVRNGNSEEEGQRPRASVLADRESGDAARKFWARRRRALLVGSGRFDFLPLTHAFCGATNRGKTSSLVVSLLTNCKNNRE
jgi:hypothetical protein